MYFRVEKKNNNQSPVQKNKLRYKSNSKCCTHLFYITLKSILYELEKNTEEFCSQLTGQ